MKRIVSTILCIVLVLAALPTVAFADQPGDSLSNPIYISNQAGLNNIRNGLDRCYEITNDIVLSGNWVPIGTKERPFQGRIEGNGFTISNLTISTGDETQYVGFFGYILENALISNLNLFLSDAGVKSNVEQLTSVYIGGFVGYCADVQFGFRTLDNCTVSGGAVTITSSCEKGTVYIGGMAGYLVSSSGKGNLSSVDIVAKVTNSEVNAGGFAGYLPLSVSAAGGSTGNVTAISANGRVCAGGFVGAISTGLAYSVHGCYGEGNVYAEGKYVYAGGVCGFGTNNFVYQCYSRGNVEAVSHAGISCAGGLAGDVSSINECFSSGNVVARSMGGNAYVGGFAGQTNLAKNCYSLGNTSASATSTEDRPNVFVYDGAFVGYHPTTNSVVRLDNCFYAGSSQNNRGIGMFNDGFSAKQERPLPSDYPGEIEYKTNAQLKNKDTFAGWNFETIWGMDSSINDGYPYLQKILAATAVTPAPTPEPDIPGVSEWAQDAVKFLISHGIIPTEMQCYYQDAITRAEAVTVMVNTYEGVRQQTLMTGSPFTDIDGHACKTWIEKGYNAGIINGVSATQFNPGGTLTREQAAKIACDLVSKIEGITITSSKMLNFIDTTAISTWAQPYVAYAVENGIMQGMSTTEFVPQGNLTREQTFVILHRLILKYGWEVHEVLPGGSRPILDDKEFAASVLVEGGVYFKYDFGTSHGLDTEAQTSEGYGHTGIDIYVPGESSNAISNAVGGSNIKYPFPFNSNVLSAMPSFGNSVIIEVEAGGQKYVMVYGHMDEVYFKNGDTVKRGQTLGTVGKTGATNEYHLHFEVREGAIGAFNNKVFINPVTFISNYCR